MAPHLRFLFLLLPLAFGLGSPGSSPQAAEAQSSRFAFADTTLLRDTLNLEFDLLFPLADSLRITPDSLRALAIRYRIPIVRMVHLADSLRVPVDSVGVTMERERYNPLSASVERVSAFAYSSSYGIARGSNTWSNNSDYNFVLGSLFLRNLTSISVSRTREGSLTNFHKSRTMNTEFGWRFSKGFSLGGRVSLDGVSNFKPNSIYNNTQNNYQYNFSIRTKQRPTKNLESNVDFFGGPYDEPGGVPIKRGFGGVLSSRVSYRQGQWLTNDVSAQINGRFGRAQLPERPWLDTRDLTTNLRVGASLFQNSRVQMQLGGTYRKSTFDRPDTSTVLVDTIATVRDFVRNQPNSTVSGDLAVRVQQSANRYYNFSGSLGRTLNTVSVSRDGVFARDQNTSQSQLFSADAQYLIRRWSLDGRFSNRVSVSEQPRRSLSGGTSVYFRERQRVHSRSVEMRASRSLSRRLTVNGTGSVSLNSAFIRANGLSNHTVDDYRQSYALEGQYAVSQKANTRLRLEVARILSINLLAASSASNREDRSYRGSWNWTYGLLPGLTVNQSNQLSASYIYYSFTPDRNKLTLDYANQTTLNAVVTRRLAVTLNHSARLAPSGNYTRGPDARDYFGLSDEGRDYNLRGSITYQPIPNLSLRLEPTYSASERDGTVDGQAVPSNRRRSLNFSGGGSIDLPVGKNGRVSGAIARTFSSSRSTQYTNGVPVESPLASDDYWNGSLQFSWHP